MSIVRTIVVLSLVLLMPAFAFGAEPVVLSWGDCVREAAKTNPELAASLRNVDQKRAEKWVATSPMLPQFSSEASVSRLDNISGGGRRDNNTYSVRGEQLLFDGFKTYSEFKTAEQNLKASQYTSSEISSGLRYNLREAFAQLLKAQKLVPITSGIIERRSENLRMIRLRYESGREHEGALLLAQADLAQARYDHRKARRDISVAQYALRRAMGWSDDKPMRVKGDFTLLRPVPAKPDLRELAGGHPSVERSGAERKSAGYELKAAKAEFFPTFDADAEVGKVAGGGFQGSNNGWKVGLNASLPIFEGGRRIANTRRARARLLETTSNETDEYDTVLANLESAWQQLKDAVEYYGVQKKYLEADRVRAKIARAQYANGLLIFDNWIIIENNYVRSQIATVEAGAAMMVAEAEWIRAKGETLHDE